MPRERCENWAELLVDYADGEFDQAERVRVAAHLEACPDCRRRLEALRNSLALAQGVWSERAAELDQTSAAATGRRIRTRRRAPWVAIAAAAAVLLVVLRPLQSPRPTPVVPASTEQGSVAQVEQEIWEIGIASEMLLVADMLAATPGGEPYAVNRLRFITENYADTQPAREAQIRLAALTERKMP
jgi:anti-sigma factor RsiW